MSVLFIPHGGGPLPLLNDPGHLGLINFLLNVSKDIPTPKNIVIISAHWEAEPIEIISGESPGLLYDYYGFPPEAYTIKYPTKGNPELAKKIKTLFNNNGIKAEINSKRGFDHGVFVPLKLIYPKANIPCIQISLSNSLDPKKHLELGSVLSEINSDDVLFLGSGLSFHNMGEMFNSTPLGMSKSIEFDNWLTTTVTDKYFSYEDRVQRLIDWESAPNARYCHPREEHLLPLFVSLAISGEPGKQVYSDELFGKMVSGYFW